MALRIEGKTKDRSDDRFVIDNEDAGHPTPFGLFVLSALRHRNLKARMCARQHAISRAPSALPGEDAPLGPEMRLGLARRTP